MINIEGDNAVVVFTIRQPLFDDGEITSYELVDPASLQLVITDPAGASTTYVFGTDSELTKLETGVYRLEITVPLAGEWDVRIESVGPTLVDEQAFMVGESQTWDVVPPLSDYELFIGASASSFSAMALDQAQLLLQIATGISSKPSDPTSLRIYRFGIFAMAEALEASQATRTIAFSPFRVEEIGSYRYERARGDVRSGIPTGILWFDMAVEHFNSLSSSDLHSMHSSIGLFEYEDNLRFVDSSGRDQVIGPGDIDPRHIDQYGLFRRYGVQIGPD